MSTNKTQNYQLNQWVKSDPVLMEDFNADNAKIDEALSRKANTAMLTSLQIIVDGKAPKSALNALQTTVTSQGTALSQRNCRFVTGSYTGTGEYGPSHANTLTFPQKPVFVCITSDGTGMQLNLVSGQSSTLISEGGVSTLAVTWGSKSVSWYVQNPSASGSAPAHQMNAASLYHYFAILEI